MTSKVQIITNNHVRDLLYWHDLTDTEKQEFDWIDSSEDYQFFRYRGWTYCMADFMSITKSMQTCKKDFPNWDGYMSDTFFSGVLVRYPIDEFSDSIDGIIVGTFYSGSDHD